MLNAPRYAIALWLFVEVGVAARALSADTPALMTITVEPAAVGEQLVRASLPFAAGGLRADQTIVVSDGTSQTRASVRPLTWHHGEGQDATVRRGLTTFSYCFADRRPVTFELDAASADTGSERAFPARIEASNDRWDVIYRSGSTLQASSDLAQVCGLGRLEA